MIFTILVLLSAFFIESIGTYVSILGLASLFSSNPIIIALAIALDIGKVASVSFLYKHWKKINLIMKTYMAIASVVLMLITSAGAFGFLSAEFQKAISSTNVQTVLLQSLEDEKQRLQARKEQIDKQIAQLPENNVRGRSLLIKQFGPEVTRINSRLAELDKQLPDLKVEAIKKNVEVGPIMFISTAFGITPEKAVKWVIFTIIFVFDPLAISLLLAANFLFEQRKREKENLIPQETKKEEVQETIKESTPEVIEESQPEVQAEEKMQDQIEPEKVKTEIPLPQLKKRGRPKKYERPSADVFIDNSGPLIKSSLEDVVIKNDKDVIVEIDEKHKSSQIRGFYQDLE